MLKMFKVRTLSIVNANFVTSIIPILDIIQADQTQLCFGLLLHDCFYCGRCGFFSTVLNVWLGRTSLN